MNKMLLSLLLSLTLFAEESDTSYLKMQRESYQKITELVLLVKKSKKCFEKATSRKKARKCLKLSKDSSKDVKETFNQIVYDMGGESLGKKKRKKFIWNKKKKREIISNLERVNRDSFNYAKCMKTNDNYSDFHRCLERSGL